MTDMTDMTNTPEYHQLLAKRLRLDPAFAYRFARRVREVPPVDESRLLSMRALSFRVDAETGAPGPLVANLVIGAYVRRDAEPPPGREPWPRRWALLIEVLGAGPVEPEVLVTWPLRYANLRATLACPITHLVVVPNHAIVRPIAARFSLEPELMPTIVVSSQRDGQREPLPN